jgi:type IX secretion system PorP/SprF family membrane protein
MCAAVVGTSFAQQDPQFTQYMFDRLSVNPGFAGTTGSICATALLRQQWTGFDGAPKTGLFNVHMPVSKISSGIGVTVTLDELGQQQNTNARLHYSFHRKINQGTLGIGVYAGLASRTLGRDWVAIDPVADDLAIPINGANNSGFDLGAGIYYVHPKFWLGLSSTQLPETEFPDVSIKNVRHYYAQGGYDLELGGDPKYVLQPSTLIKTDGTSMQVDLNATFLYNKTVWLGVSYRTEDAIAPMIGYQQAVSDGNGFVRIGYSYDLTTSELRNYSSGSHEIMLSYCFNIVPKPDLQIYRNVRFL